MLADNDDQEFWIPRTLDAPPLLFVWEADVAFAYAIWVFIGMVADMMVVGVVLSLILGKAYVKLKEEGGNGLIVKFLYWFTPSDLWLSKRHPSSVREYIG